LRQADTPFKPIYNIFGYRNKCDLGNKTMEARQDVCRHRHGCWQYMRSGWFCDSAVFQLLYWGWYE
jgi:hypothetical protein